MGAATAHVSTAHRDSKDSRTPGLSADWRQNIAYNAELQLATAALVAAGYRASRQMHHYRVIHSLAHTIGADAKLIGRLDQFRKGIVKSFRWSALPGLRIGETVFWGARIGSDLAASSASSGRRNESRSLVESSLCTGKPQP